jgi:hypothetical protein
LRAASHALRAAGSDVEGAALLCATSAADNDGDRAGGGGGGVSGFGGGSEREVLLTRDAGIVAEVARTEAALLEAAAAAAAAAAKRVDAALLALGHALLPGCAPALAARAAGEALAHGRRAAAARVLREAAARANAEASVDADADADAAVAFELPLGVTLQHAAACRGDAWGVRALLAAGGACALFGAPHARCTPQRRRRRARCTAPTRLPARRRSSRCRP